MSHLADPVKDFPQWYLDVIAEAGLAEHADVKGCIIFKPYGYAIWEAIQSDLDRRIKALGVQNAYFPLLIPESLMAKEKDHVKGFAPECAIVTHGGGKELSEKLYVRPTSETIIYATFARWIHSHRDLPLKMNQWANVVRWEMRTRPFLRTLEFLWQEGHTCHRTKEEADTMVRAALQMYADFDREMLAIPVLMGQKPEHEKFAGALYTLSTEALAKDGKAIQAGTSHNLGQGFSQAYGVKFLAEDNTLQYPWMTSWGLSTRMIGALIMVHGDGKGLRLPPRVAPIQVVIIPIGTSGAEKERILVVARSLAVSLDGIRVYLDDREEKSPGFKFNEWEVKGVPLRIEIGPRDLEKRQVTMVRRDTGEKCQVPRATCQGESVRSMLDDIQQSLYDQARVFMEEHTHEATSFDGFQKMIDGGGGFVWALWDGERETAEKIQERTKASIRLVEPSVGGRDILSGTKALYRALYARSY